MRAARCREQGGRLPAVEGPVGFEGCELHVVEVSAAAPAADDVEVSVLGRRPEPAAGRRRERGRSRVGADRAVLIHVRESDAAEIGRRARHPAEPVDPLVVDDGPAEAEGSGERRRRLPASRTIAASRIGFRSIRGRPAVPARCRRRRARGGPSRAPVRSGREPARSRPIERAGRCDAWGPPPAEGVESVPDSSGNWWVGRIRPGLAPAQPSGPGPRGGRPPHRVD